MEIVSKSFEICSQCLFLFFSNFFVRTVLRALKYHKFAQKYLKKDAPKALRWVQRCAPLADKLVEASTKMVHQSEQLKNMTEDAFLETQRNDVQNTGEIRRTSKCTLNYQIYGRGDVFLF